MIEWLKKLFKQEEKEENKLQIWCVLQGPIHVSDMPEDEVPDFVTDNSVYMVLKVSQRRQVWDQEFWFDNFEDAYKILRHFHESIEPLTLNSKEYDLV